MIAQIASDQADSLSADLLDRFGSLGALYAHLVSEPGLLTGCSADIGRFLRDVALFLSEAIRREVTTGPIVSGTESVLAFLHQDMAFRVRETFRTLFLDTANRLLADRILWEGSVSRVQIHPREVLRQALELHATALIFVHNHPSGDPTPSRDDIEQTRKLSAACAAMDIHVHDHLIIGRAGHVSLRERGLLA